MNAGRREARKIRGALVSCIMIMIKRSKGVIKRFAMKVVVV